MWKVNNNSIQVWNAYLGEGQKEKRCLLLQKMFRDSSGHRTGTASGGAEEHRNWNTQGIGQGNNFRENEIHP